MGIHKEICNEVFTKKDNYCFSIYQREMIKSLLEWVGGGLALCSGAKGVRRLKT